MTDKRSVVGVGGFATSVTLGKSFRVALGGPPPGSRKANQGHDPSAPKPTDADTRQVRRAKVRAARKAQP